MNARKKNPPVRIARVCLSLSLITFFAFAHAVQSQQKPSSAEVSVVLDVNGRIQEIPNDFVWIFAGGEPPTAFLKKIGIRCGAQDLTNSAGQEAKEAKAAREAALALR